MKPEMRRLILLALCTLLLVVTDVKTTAQAAPQPAGHSELAQVSGAVATVVVARASIWAGPGRGFWWIGFLFRNATVPLLGVSADGQWWQVNTPDGIGWLRGLDVTTNTSAVPVIDPGPIGIITAGVAVVHAGPGIGAQQVALISHGSQFFIIGRRPDGSWLEIRYRFGRGWVAASVTDQAGAAQSNVSASVGGPRAIVNTGALNVRTGPGFGFASIGVLRGGEVVPIIGRNKAGDWLQVQTPFGDGWINIVFVITKDYFGSAPETSGQATGALTAATFRVLGGSANVRSGPGVGFPVLFTVDTGMTFSIIGQSRDRLWWYIDTPFGKGWINKQLGQSSGAISSVPVVQ